MSFSLFTFHSTWPLLMGQVKPALTAALLSPPRQQIAEALPNRCWPPALTRRRAGVALFLDLLPEGETVSLSLLPPLEYIRSKRVKLTVLLPPSFGERQRFQRLSIAARFVRSSQVGMRSLVWSIPVRVPLSLVHSVLYGLLINPALKNMHRRQ